MIKGWLARLQVLGNKKVNLQSFADLIHLKTCHISDCIQASLQLPMMVLHRQWLARKPFQFSEKLHDALMDIFTQPSQDVLEQILEWNMNEHRLELVQGATCREKENISRYRVTRLSAIKSL